MVEAEVKRIFSDCSDGAVDGICHLLKQFVGRYHNPAGDTNACIGVDFLVIDDMVLEYAHDADEVYSYEMSRDIDSRKFLVSVFRESPAPRQLIQTHSRLKKNRGPIHFQGYGLMLPDGIFLSYKDEKLELTLEDASALIHTAYPIVRKTPTPTKSHNPKLSFIESPFPTKVEYGLWLQLDMTTKRFSFIETPFPTKVEYAQWLARVETLCA